MASAVFYVERGDSVPHKFQHLINCEGLLSFAASGGGRRAPGALYAHPLCRAHRPRCAGWDATQRGCRPRRSTHQCHVAAAEGGCRTPGALYAHPLCRAHRPRCAAMWGCFLCSWPKKAPPHPRKESRFWRSSDVTLSSTTVLLTKRGHPFVRGYFYNADRGLASRTANGW